MKERLRDDALDRIAAVRKEPAGQVRAPEGVADEEEREQRESGADGASRGLEHQCEPGDASRRVGQRLVSRPVAERTAAEPRSGERRLRLPHDVAAAEHAEPRKGHVERPHRPQAGQPWVRRHVQEAQHQTDHRKDRQLRLRRQLRIIDLREREDAVDERKAGEKRRQRRGSRRGGRHSFQIPTSR